MSIPRAWTISLAAGLMACGGHTLDVGSTGGAEGTRVVREDAGADGSSNPVWNGTLENAQLADGSNRLTMTLFVADDGAANGTLLLGDGALLRPPTDPNVGYPPGAQFSFGGPLGFFEGFPYTIVDGRLSGSVLTFQVAEFELWTRWCALQTPFPEFVGGDGGYVCTNDNWGSSGGTTGCSETNSATREEMPVDCGKLALCMFTVPCDCSATRCRVASSGPVLSFDLMLTSTTADGTISGLLGDHDVHFVRAQ